MFKRMFLRMPVTAAQSGYRCLGFICKKKPDTRSGFDKAGVGVNSGYGLDPG